MKTLITLLTASSMTLFCAAPVLAATLEECKTAAAIAQKHDNEWQETEFTPHDCAVISKKSVDAAFVLMNPKSRKGEIDRAIRNLQEPSSALNPAPAIKLTPKPKVHGSAATPHNAGRSTERRCLQTGYVEDGEGFHHLFVYDRCTGNIM